MKKTSDPKTLTNDDLQSKIRLCYEKKTWLGDPMSPSIPVLVCISQRQSTTRQTDFGNISTFI